MKTPEEKVIEQIANLAESHWFNPAVFGRQLSEQPFYTLDRLMEMVVHIIRGQAIRHHNEISGDTTEGLWLANELDKHIQSLQKQYKFSNLKLPQTPKEQKKFLKNMPDPTVSRYSWTQDKANLTN